MQPFLTGLRTTMKVNTYQVQKEAAIHNFFAGPVLAGPSPRMGLSSNFTKIVEEGVPVSWFGPSKSLNLQSSGRNCFPQRYCASEMTVHIFRLNLQFIQ